MRRSILASAGAAIASAIVSMGCSGDDTNPAVPGTDAGNASDSAAAAPLFTPSIACTDSVDSIYGAPGTLPADKGDIIHCETDPDISQSDLQARAAADVSGDDLPATNVGYIGKQLTSGTHVYRILYRTERGDTASSPGYSSAKVFIPTTPRASGKLPFLVGARGSRGQAAICAASKEDPAAVAVNGDYDALAYSMVGAGFPIIVPDLAGYANFGASGNPVSGYAQLQDVAKSTLDGARALIKMFPNAFSGKVAIVGHSQGGHSAFASWALQQQQTPYAPELTISAIATFSPLWISQATWGALLFEPTSYPLAQAPGPNAVSIWYHYTHGELLDGPGHGVDVFAADKQAAIKSFVDNDCWAAGYNGSDAGSEYPDLQAVATTAADLFDPSFVASIKGAAALGHACAAGDDVCAKWVARYANDRPHLVNTPPILIEYGGDDDTIPPSSMACVTDRLKNQDHVPYTFCLDPMYGHEGIVRAHADHVADWLGYQTMGEPAPAACTLGDANLTDDAGILLPCATPPPND